MPAARVLSFLILLCSALPAQQETATTAPPRPPAVVVTLSFRGGSMAEFVAAVRAAEAKANIVVAAAAADAKLPAIELRGAGIDQALEGACAVAEAVYPVRVKDFTGAGEPVYSITSMGPVQYGNVSGTATTNASPAPARADETTQVFSLNRLTEPDPRFVASEGLKVETILSAIEAGTSDDAKKAVLRYHRDSGLLFLRGTRAQITIIKDLLSNLERDLEERRRRAVTPAPKDGAKEAAKETERKD